MMNKKLLSIFKLAILLLFFTSCAELQAILGGLGKELPTSKPLTEQEIVRGLKTALIVGTDTAVNLLAKPNGYLDDRMVKIKLPNEINSAISQLKSSSAGMTIYNNSIKKLEEDMLIAFNRAAENAAQKATPIFKNSIRTMSIRDGLSILRGTDDAATQYLKRTTYPQLRDAYKPEIKQALNQPVVLNYSSERIYNDFVNAYNKVVENDRLNLLKLSKIPKQDLSAYVVERALDGLFLKIAEEEKEIRNDPRARVEDILRKVFGNLP